MFKRFVAFYRKIARKKRAKIFNNLFHPTKDDIILDLGGDDGGHIASVVPFRENVTIADISKARLKQAQDKYGFNTIVLKEDGTIPAEPKQYDIIFCSSVIEHVTVDKDEAANIKSKKEFEKKAFERQKKLAREIASKSKSYFVQTPYKYFLIESHTWLPIFFIFFPRKVQLKIIAFLFKSIWPKKVRWLDFNLLTVKDMKKLFPDAKIVKEKSFGFTKSLMAVKIDSRRSSNLTEY